MFKVGAWGATHLRKLVGDDPHLGIRCPVAARLFRQIGQSFDVKNRADDGVENRSNHTDSSTVRD